jgi:hypothetical protein
VPDPNPSAPPAPALGAPLQGFPARGEVSIARFFCHRSRQRITSNIKSLEKNKDVEASAIASDVYEFGGYPFDLWN